MKFALACASLSLLLLITLAVWCAWDGAVLVMEQAGDVRERVTQALSVW